MFVIVLRIGLRAVEVERGAGVENWIGAGITNEPRGQVRVISEAY